jgi:phosphoribosyl-AMP cyclohydrolase
MSEPTPMEPLAERIAGLKFDAAGLVPAVIQQYDTREVLMLAWMDAEAVRRTCTTGRTWFWSRSRAEYWCKGETSGNIQRVVEAWYDCDGDALLVAVDQTGVACHTGERTCFYQPLCGPFAVDRGPHVTFVPSDADE